MVIVKSWENCESIIFSLKEIFLYILHEYEMSMKRMQFKSMQCEYLYEYNFVR